MFQSNLNLNLNQQLYCHQLSHHTQPPILTSPFNSQHNTTTPCSNLLRLQQPTDSDIGGVGDSARAVR